jgi:predicted PurR-regulated permease PerM
LALALNPIVAGVERRLRCRRGIAVAVVLASFVAAVLLIAVLLGPETVRQARNLQQDIPDVVDQLTELPLVGDSMAENDVPDKVQRWLEDLPGHLAGNTSAIEGTAKSVVNGALALIATLLVTVTLLLDGARLVRGARRAIPRRYRDQADRLGDLFYNVVGRYFAGSVLVAVLNGLGVLVVGLVLGVPLAPLLAVWVAVFNMVPQIGGAVGGIPFVLLGFTQSATTGVICAVYFVLYLNFENHILTPVVVGEAVDLSPPTTMVGAIVGVSVAGVPGALVAVPLLGVLKAAYIELRPPDEGAPAKQGPARQGRLRRLLSRLGRSRRADPEPAERRDRGGGRTGD